MLKIKQKCVVNLQWLSILALKYIFDKDNMSYLETKHMEESNEAWKMKVNLNPIERADFLFILTCLKANINGYYTEQKEFFKMYDISYLNVYSCGLSM